MKNFSYTRKLCVLFLQLILNFSINSQIYLDTTFGTSQNGTVTFNNGTQTIGYAVGLQSSGKIIVGGSANISGVNSIVLARYLTNGTLDTTFGTNGFTTTSIGSDAQGFSLSIQSDDKIIIAGSSIVAQTEIIVARYTVNGVLDTTFGTLGITATQLGVGASACCSLVQPADQFIVVAGSAVVNGTGQFMIARYNTVGVLDSTFGSGGIVTVAVGTLSSAQAIAIESNNKLVIAGSAQGASHLQYALVRLNTDGSLDSGFGSSGIVTTAVTNSTEDRIYGVAIQSDQKIVVAGHSIINSITQVSLARYTTAGILDNSFGTSGIVTTAVSDFSYAQAITIQPDGKSVITGASDNQICTARYTTAGVLDGTFGNNGIVTSTINARAMNNSIVLQPDGKIVTAGAADSSATVVRYLTNNSDFVTITSPANLATISTTPFTITGTASGANCTIQITIDSTIMGTTPTDSNGNWSFTVSQLSNGSHTILASLTCPNSPPSIATATITISVSATNAIAITSPTSGSITTTQTPTLSGTSSASGGSVQITIDGVVTNTVTTDSQGNWTATAPTLSIGSHTMVAALLTTAATATVTFNVISTTSNLDLAHTTAATIGVITKSGLRFIHDYGSAVDTSNTYVGTNAGNFSNTGTRNTGIGALSLTSLASGGSNTALGYQSLTSNASGNNNTAIGAGALASNASSSNTAVGFNALNANTAGAPNTAVGASALAANTTGVNNVAIGNNALGANASGIQNTALGVNALSTNASSSNTAVGFNALTANTTGAPNTAVGAGALAANTIGTNNVAIGSSSLGANTTGIQNTAIGSAALATSITASSNTAIGYRALTANTTGTPNIAIGANALAANTTGINNLAIGNNALSTNASGIRNTAVGMNALSANVSSSNSAIGFNALTANTTGAPNTAVGASALAANTTGVNNTAIGFNALAANTTGIQNTAIGDAALTASVTASSNTAVGYHALTANTRGTPNTAVGFNALAANTTGLNNVAVGDTALQSNIIGTNCTAIGSGALKANTQGQNNSALGFNALATIGDNTNCTAIGCQALSNVNAGDCTAVGFQALVNNTASQNTAVGSSSASSNTSGTGITAIGYLALNLNTTGNNNTAVGINALKVNTTGGGNVAVGDNTLIANVTGIQNTAIGSNALGSNASGSNNVAVGFKALFVNASTNNCAVGSGALQGNTNGGQNTALGRIALFANTIGSNNVAVGFQALRLTTGDNNIGIGSNAGSALTSGANNIDIGNIGVAAESNTIRIGTTGTQNACFISGINGQTSASGIAVLVNSSDQLGTTTSTRNHKENIESMAHMSSQFRQLRPVTFQYKAPYDDGFKLKQYGLIAEEVSDVMPQLVQYDNQGNPFTVRYHFLTPLLIQVWKEHDEIINKQEETISLQQRRIDELMTRIVALEQHK